MALRVFLPEQLLGYALALEFLMNRGPVWYLKAPGDRWVGAGIEEFGQLPIVKLRRQRRGESERLGFAQQLLNRADTEFGAGFDLSHRQAGRQP